MHYFLCNTDNSNRKKNQKIKIGTVSGLVPFNLIFAYQHRVLEVTNFFHIYFIVETHSLKDLQHITNVSDKKLQDKQNNYVNICDCYY